MFQYLGAYHQTFLMERDGKFYMQFNDWGFEPKWIEARISRSHLDKIIASGRDEGDMALVVGTDNIPPGAKPVWESHPVEYLTWHRDNDPSPWSERAAAALAALRDYEEPAS
ncbi:MAG: hypothetical protein ABW128_23005 [Rhizorhabdus sp.]